MRGLAVGIALASIATEAGAMPVSTFLLEVESLDPDSAAGKLTSQVSELKNELQRDAAELRAERLAASAAGKTPAYCPPDSAHQPGADEIIGALEEIPKDDRPNVEVKDAIRAYLAYRFPC
jgi:hypothetical protein